jgi:hypothetical protein
MEEPMAKDRLVVFESQGVYRIGWYLVDEQDMGMTIGEDLDDIHRSTEKDHVAVTMALKDQEETQRDNNGFYWETKAMANRTLTFAKHIASLSLKSKSSVEWPAWTKKALAAGWKPPKNWKP